MEHKRDKRTVPCLLSEAHQVVEVKRAKNVRESFKLSGWAKGYALPEHGDDPDSPKFRLRAVINYDDGTEEQQNTTQTETASFTPRTDGWQYTSVEFSKDAYKAIDNITIYCDYAYNTGNAYFDNIEFIGDKGTVLLSPL